MFRFIIVYMFIQFNEFTDQGFLQHFVWNFVRVPSNRYKVCLTWLILLEVSVFQRAGLPVIDWKKLRYSFHLIFQYWVFGSFYKVYFTVLMTSWLNQLLNRPSIRAYPPLVTLYLLWRKGKTMYHLETPSWHISYMYELFCLVIWP